MKTWHLSFIDTCIFSGYLCKYILPCDAKHSAVLLWQVACLSICLSVTLRYRDHIGWNYAKITSVS